ncbi:MAG: PD-(D/E)XK nuclease family transposase [Clostridium sp.]
MDFEKKHQEDLQRLRGFRLLDDDFMTKVFEDISCAELLLRIILNDEGIRVLEAHSQRGIKNLQGRSVKLDILAVDSHNRVFNVEVQRSDRGAGAKRARYNSALIDANVTEPGDQYEDLNETFVIFITENDVMKAGLPIYHTDRVVRETGKLFEDEEHIIYVNSQIKDETKLGRLMHDFSCTDAKDMYNKVLADRVRYFKEDERGVEIMCREMEIMRNQAHEEGIEKGRIMQLIKQVCVKMQKFSSAEEVANDLVEQDVPLIQKIMNVAPDFAPDYNVNDIYNALKL